MTGPSFTSSIDQAPVEAALVVGNDPEPGDLRCQAFRLRRAVPPRHSEQDAEPGGDLSDHLAVDPDAGLADALAHRPHAPGIVIR